MKGADRLVKAPPPPTTLVCDSREQLPWLFDIDGLPAVVTVTRKLDAGDYSVEGLESRVAVERKTAADFLSTVTAGRARFEAELVRLTTYERAVIVVEESFDYFVSARYRNAVPPQCIVGSVASFFARYGVATVFAGSRRNAQILTATFLIKAAKHLGTPVAPAETETP